MKNLLKRIILSVSLIFIFAGYQTAILAQTIQPIEFAKGKSSVSVAGKGNQSYTIRIGAGRNCKIQLVSTGNKALLEVFDAKGMDLTEGSDGRSFEGGFESTTDLKINVTAKAVFTLKISVK